MATLKENYPFSETEVFQREGFPVMYFVERRYADDPTNWWVPNRACVEAMLRSAGFEIVRTPRGGNFHLQEAEAEWLRRSCLWNEPNNLSHWNFELDPNWTIYSDHG